MKLAITGGTGFVGAHTVGWEELEDGGLAAAQGANKIWTRMRAEYEAPPIDDGIDEALLEYIVKRKASFPDSEV